MMITVVIVTGGGGGGDDVIQLTPRWGFSVADYIRYYAYF